MGPVRPAPPAREQSLAGHAGREWSTIAIGPGTGVLIPAAVTVCPARPTPSLNRLPDSVRIHIKSLYKTVKIYLSSPEAETRFEVGFDRPICGRQAVRERIALQRMRLRFKTFLTGSDRTPPLNNPARLISSVCGFRPEMTFFAALSSRFLSATSLRSRIALRGISIRLENMFFGKIAFLYVFIYYLWTVGDDPNPSRFAVDSRDRRVSHRDRWDGASLSGVRTNRPTVALGTDRYPPALDGEQPAEFTRRGPRGRRGRTR